MIIKATKPDREFLDKELRKLIKENDCESHITQDQITEGVTTLLSYFSPLDRAKWNRANELVREVASRMETPEAIHSLVFTLAIHRAICESGEAKCQ